MEPWEKLKGAVDEGLFKIAAMSYKAAADRVRIWGIEHRGEGFEAEHAAKLIADEIEQFGRDSVSAWESSEKEKQKTIDPRRNKRFYCPQCGESFSSNKEKIHHLLFKRLGHSRGEK